MQGAERTIESLSELIDSGNSDRFRALLAEMPPGEGARLITRLTKDQQRRVLEWLTLDDAASLLRAVPQSSAADFLRLLPHDAAAQLLGHLPSNEQADLLAEMGTDAVPLLAAMPDEASSNLRRLAVYPENSAGGLMVTEYVVYRDDATVADAIDDLRKNAARYSRLEVQYAYVVDRSDRLVGTLRLRDLLLLDRDDAIRDAMTTETKTVSPDTTLEQLERLFDRFGYYGLPVVDSDGRMLGVVLRVDVEEAISARAERDMLVRSGVLGGEELRSMPWSSRIARRTPWLAVSLLLSLTAASVIGLYEETLAAVISLAVFLPVISGMGGNAGNQAMAVSIRELSLGLIEPHEFAWVLFKESSVAIVNGLIMGISLGLIAWFWDGSAVLGGVVGVSIVVSTVWAACLGGIVPLALRRVGWDPALASGPILFTTIDLCGFLFALAFAKAMLPWMHVS